ncbi:hypothetical protein F0365_06525 [Nonlabens sp. Ci31]|jgi:hypothetical protein|nr:hypothetical protein F0365_06525 [Nonlabens sp. Ci31]
MMNLFKNANMKNLNNIFTIAFVSIIVFSCVEDDDFSIPDTATVAIEPPANLIDMSSVIGQIGQSPTGIVTFENNEQFIEGYVISSDEAGNYFEELIIQDAIENPTAGIKVLIDNSPLFTTYAIGQRVYVKLDGLSAGKANGVPVIGLNGTNGTIEKITPALQDTAVLRDSEIFEIIPTALTASTEFSDQRLLTLIKLEAAQFTDADISANRTFASEATDQFDGVRMVQTCFDFFDSIVLETSTFSDFKALRLPAGSGSITAILSRDFRDTRYVISVNFPADFNFDSTLRCVFDIVACGTVTDAGSHILLSENFETLSNGAAAMPTGWTNIIEAGSETWEVYTSSGQNASLGKSVRCSSRNSGDANTVSWLITPAFNFDVQTGEVFSFETSNSFANNSNMQVLFSSDWDGTNSGVAAARWEALADAIIVSDEEFFPNWIFSNHVSLDCVTGLGHIAFRYSGFDDDNNDGTYELDNVSLTSN